MSYIFKFFKRHSYESLILYLLFSLTWFGFGDYTASVLLIAFIVGLFFKEKRKFLFQDSTMVVFIILFTLSAVISSLFSTDKLISTLLSLSWFFVLIIPMSFARFSLYEKDESFIKLVVPTSLVIALIILGYLFYHVIGDLIHKDFYFKRYTFFTLGKASTPDILVMLSGIGYGFLREKKKKYNVWISFVYLLACGLGIIFTYDRGGIISFLVVAILLLSFDYPRLIIFLSMIGMVIFLSFKVDVLQGLRHLFDYLYLKDSQNILEHGQQLDTFKTALAIIKDHWLLGVGTNNFSKFTPYYGSGNWFTYAHNFVLQFWAENGLFGMLFGNSIIAIVIYRWLKSFSHYKKKYISLGVGASFCGMLVGNLTNSTIWILKVALPFWLLAGVISSIYFLTANEKLEAIQEKL